MCPGRGDAMTLGENLLRVSVSSGLHNPFPDTPSPGSRQPTLGTYLRV